MLSHNKNCLRQRDTTLLVESSNKVQSIENRSPPRPDLLFDTQNTIVASSLEKNYNIFGNRTISMAINNDVLRIELRMHLCFLKTLPTTSKPYLKPETTALKSSVKPKSTALTPPLQTTYSPPPPISIVVSTDEQPSSTNKIVVAKIISPIIPSSYAPLLAKKRRKLILNDDEEDDVFYYNTDKPYDNQGNQQEGDSNEGTRKELVLFENPETINGDELAKKL
ncbi:hypothetical protein L1987_39655 [Smallanthus sonchifolius]|uniref:Uncharacterized protein n=1 Tax=Smallanthus sonchifolius TaxID=185202 RepID=A0ACB9HNS6_9ASTR|nr:hypothetical protein L1987_39655 [Smallanthus sonchifolius]